MHENPNRFVFDIPVFIELVVFFAVLGHLGKQSDAMHARQLGTSAWGRGGKRDTARERTQRLHGDPKQNSKI